MEYDSATEYDSAIFLKLPDSGAESPLWRSATLRFTVGSTLNDSDNSSISLVSNLRQKVKVYIYFFLGQILWKFLSI